MRRSRTSRGGTTSAWTTVLDQSFDAIPLGNPVSLANARTAVGDSTVGGASTFNAFSIISHSGGRAWQWHSPANTDGNSAGVGCATFPQDPLVAYTSTHGDILTAAIEYDITFPANMDWSRGGKIPGLGATRTAANPPTGGFGPSNDGWSGRAMWLTSLAGSFYGVRAQSPNEWVGYRYSPNQPDAFGENIWTGCSFVAGVTHNIRQEYVMNTVTGGVGNADGKHRMYFDSALVSNQTTVVWRNIGDFGINRHLWHFFRGGSDSLWDGAVDNDIIVDNLLIQVQ